MGATLHEMPATDFVHEIEIRVPPARLHAFLCDLHNYVPLHPLIESIEEIPPMNELPGARRYRVVERVSIEAPLILRRFVVSQARQSHKETLSKMKAWLEESFRD